MKIQELEQCILMYGKDIYSFCKHLTNDPASADDLYQDTFLEAVKKITTIQYKDNPKSYLLSIALRLWKNKRRKFAWRNRIAPQVSDDALVETVCSDQSDFISTLIIEEEKKCLWQAMDHLSDSYRIPILLYYMEEQSIPDIAKLLSLPEGTVKSRLHYARKQLGKELEEYFS